MEGQPCYSQPGDLKCLLVRGSGPHCSLCHDRVCTSSGSAYHMISMTSRDLRDETLPACDATDGQILKIRLSCHHVLWKGLTDTSCVLNGSNKGTDECDSGELPSYSDDPLSLPNDRPMFGLRLFRDVCGCKSHHQKFVCGHIT